MNGDCEGCAQIRKALLEWAAKCKEKVFGPDERRPIQARTEKGQYKPAWQYRDGRVEVIDDTKV